MMQFVMQPGMVYRYPLLGVAALLVVAAAAAAMCLELLVRRLVSVEFRSRHNDAAAAIFSIIGVTFAVLLAFVDARLGRLQQGEGREPCRSRPRTRGLQRFAQLCRAAAGQAARRHPWLSGGG